MSDKPHVHTENELTAILYSAMECFNDVMDFDITADNTIISFFTPLNGVEVYERFCNENFPDWIHENYTEEGYFESFSAFAFVGEKYGLMIRSDLKWSSSEYFRIFLHEISHIFCTVNEIEGGGFYKKYCLGSGIEDGIINAGYAVWREAIADIMADAVYGNMAMISLRDIKSEAVRLYDLILPDNPDSKKCMSLIIAYLMISYEVAGTDNWAAAKKAIREIIGFNDEFIYHIAKTVFINLHDSPFWTITVTFIINMGELYIALLTNKAFN